MENQLLLNYAIITVNDSNDKDYFDNITPFVKEALRKHGKDVISANELRNDIKLLFGLEIPVNVVSTILKKKLKPMGFIQNQNGAFAPNYDKLNQSNFLENRERLLEKHNTLIHEFIEYSKSRYDLIIEMDEAEKLIQNFIQKNYEQLLMKNKDLSYSKVVGSGEREIVLAKFILYLFEKKSFTFDYLIEIVKGTMLTNVLYFSDLSTLNMKFRNTEVYFDSTFIIYALGYAGKTKQEPCEELITMLKDSGAQLKVFIHNVEEIQGILEGCKNSLNYGKIDTHGTVAYFMDRSYEPSDIDLLIYSLEEDIEKKLCIKVKDSPSYDEHKYVIDEQKLKTHLKESINYTRQEALNKDIKSISSIVRLRKGNRSLKIETARAIFITTNERLVKKTTEFFLSEEDAKYIPPILHDSTLTNLLWLKMPNESPDLPTKRIIADCYAALSPKEHLWDRYLDRLNLWKDSKEITSEDLTQLIYSQGVRELLIEKTLGDEDAITIGTAKEILRELENKQTAKHNEEVQRTRDEKEEIKKALQQQASRTEQLHNSKKIKASEKANKKSLLFTQLLMLLTGIGFTFCVSLLSYFSSHPTFLIRWSITIVVSILTVLGFFNVNLIPITKKIRVALYNYYYVKIIREYYPELLNETKEKTDSDILETDSVNEINKIA